MKHRFHIPLLMALSMALGLWLGSGLQNPFTNSDDHAGWQKIEQILQYVESDYVDTVSKARLEDEVVAYLLQRLDPHSLYITQEDLAVMNEPLEGGFEGIGVQFNLRNDSIYIVSTINGGPSERAGLMPGDFIVEVDSNLIAGTGLNNRSVMAMLKGPKGSSVDVGVVRRGESEVLRYTIQRGEIPISSFDAIYMLNDSTIYVKLARFSRTTFDEFKERVYPLKTKMVTGFVLDLRGNGGGYLDAAVHLADEFLTEGSIITYTQGKNRPRQDYYATSAGVFKEVKLAVIIDGFSASASEIFAGCMQDLRRGTVVGQRSFGKGLVQEQNQWNDGSATRLTVARYYTPNGRSIQRPYESLSEEGGVSESDSVSGGIRPDVRVDRDTAGVTWLLAEMVHSGRLNTFAYTYRDAHLDELRNMSEDAFDKNLEDVRIKDAMYDYLKSRRIEIDEKEWNRSSSLMVLRAKAIIGRSLFGDQIYFKLFNRTDPFITSALAQLKIEPVRKVSL